MVRGGHEIGFSAMPRPNISWLPWRMKESAGIGWRVHCSTWHLEEKVHRHCARNGPRKWRRPCKHELQVSKNREQGRSGSYDGETTGHWIACNLTKWWTTAWKCHYGFLLWYHLKLAIQGHKSEMPGIPVFLQTETGFSPTTQSAGRKWFNWLQHNSKLMPKFSCLCCAQIPG